MSSTADGAPMKFIARLMMIDDGVGLVNFLFPEACLDFKNVLIPHLVLDSGKKSIQLRSINAGARLNSISLKTFFYQRKI